VTEPYGEAKSGSMPFGHEERSTKTAQSKQHIMFPCRFDTFKGRVLEAWTQSGAEAQVDLAGFAGFGSSEPPVLPMSHSVSTLRPGSRRVLRTIGSLRRDLWPR
jgi:hypothetical protein